MRARLSSCLLAWSLLAPGSLDDPLYARQWNLHAAAASAPRVDVRAEEAWELSRGSPGIVIAVVDSGIDVLHPDLAGRFCVNLAERDGATGVDDDGNGYADDVLGWDFARGSPDVSSPVQHGTEIAGLIAALGGNGLGLAGLAGGTGPGDGCRLLPVVVGDQPRAEVLAEALRYAVARGARVINLSLSVEPAPAISSALAEAVRRGVTVVCAAGNDLADTPFPANEPDVIPVACTDRAGRIAEFSTPGDAVRDRGLAAPGDDVPTLGVGGCYRMVRGTSFAAAQVAAAVGLMLSMPRGAALRPAQVRELLRSSAEPMDADPRRCGAGRLNVFRALQGVESLPP
jgi:subtilisin family serine protease